MREIQDYIPITKAKNMLLEIIRKVERDDDTIAITKKGVPIAIIFDEQAMSSLQKSIQEAKRRDWVPYEEVFGK